MSFKDLQNLLGYEVGRSQSDPTFNPKSKHEKNVEIDYSRRVFSRFRRLHRIIAATVASVCLLLLFYLESQNDLDLSVALPIVIVGLLALLVLFAYRRNGFFENNLNKTVEHIRRMK
jgi:O-antigen/teichoic acid export membrane protein